MQQHAFLSRLGAIDPVLRTGRVASIRSGAIEADGPDVGLGTLCSIETRGAGPAIMAQVVRIDRRSIILAPLSDPSDVALGCVVTAPSETRSIAAGGALSGRLVNALGRPIDGKPLLSAVRHAYPTVPPAALDRISPKKVLETGVRAIDGLLTLGLGQRIGIFAAAGVGKTSLIGQLASGVKADHVIICQIGERGREVETLWNEALPAEARKRATLVAATSDESAAMRVAAADHAIALADYWRSCGKHVLLLIDSMTRLAMALRELGLAAGEPPAMRAYTPNVFSALPRMIECCGALAGGGSITAIVTVLAESDEMDDPISELMKSILDGHILLSRGLAEKGHFPAIDIVRSISRRAETLMDTRHQSATLKARGLLAQYDTSRTLIETGLYAAGSNPEIDAAIEARPKLLDYLRQPANARVGFTEAANRLADMMAGSR